MRILVAAVGALAVAGCAASSPNRQAAVPHPIVAEATPAVAEAPPANGEAGPKQESTSDRADRKRNRVLGWVALSVGAEGAVLATITSFMMLHQNSVRSSNCADKVCSPEGIAANGKLGDLSGWNAAAWGVAAVGVGVGAFLLLTNPPDRTSPSAEFGLGQTASGSGLLLRGSF